jgi:hypothetical protein
MHTKPNVGLIVFMVIALLIALLNQPIATCVLLALVGCFIVALQKSQEEDPADRYWKARTKSTETLAQQREDRRETERLRQEQIRLKNKLLRKQLNE